MHAALHNPWLVVTWICLAGVVLLAAGPTATANALPRSSSNSSSSTANSSGSSNAASEGWSPPSGCSVPGFRLQAKQLPSSPLHAAAVVLYTLNPPHDISSSSSRSSRTGGADSPGDTADAVPTPLPDLASTAAACNASLLCVMFTSDGYLIGAYRSPEDADNMLAAISQEQQGSGPLEWVAMDYCSGECCGTWVADGLVQQLLTPVNSSSSSSSSGLQQVSKEQLPTDSPPGLPLFMDERGSQALCNNRTQTSNTTDAEAVNATDVQVLLRQCPRRCAVACCARYAQGVRVFDGQLFEQCFAGACGPDYCRSMPGVPSRLHAPSRSSPADAAASVLAKLGKLAVQAAAPRQRRDFAPRASPVADVLKLQYLRAVSEDQAPPQQQLGGMNASRPLGSTLQ